MNELTPRWRDHPEWAIAFDHRDRVVVESLVRAAADAGWSGPLIPGDDELIVAALHLARAVRLEHVALALAPEPLSRYLARVDGGEGVTAGARIVASLADASTPLARALVDRVDLRETPAASGPPIVVSSFRGAPVVAHWRSLGVAEWRLARALLTASQRDPTRSDDSGRTSPSTSPSDGDSVGRVLAVLATHGLVVVTGGPGTGKTTTVARAVHALSEATPRASGPLRVALCAPTAKAAVRLRDVVETVGRVDGADSAPIEIDERSGSVHRLLGLRPDRVVGTEIVDADLVVVDEVSMLELPLLDQLLARVSPTTDVMLAGDPDQLASVNVGAALRDIVDAATLGEPLSRIVVRLGVNHRSDTRISDVATAINAGDDAELSRALAAASPAVLITEDRDDALAVAVDNARRLSRVATTDRSSAVDLLSTFAVVCATREGPGSVQWWRSRIEPEIRRATGSRARFAPGTPVLVTRNEGGDDRDRLANGDIGVAATMGERNEVVFGPARDLRVRADTDVPDAESAWSITIHKSQGSEFDAVVVSLPDGDSPLLTRELLYTAVTRARQSVTILATPATIASALGRRVDRVSGLVERLDALVAASGARDESSVG